jgi:hypothetical protein
MDAETKSEELTYEPIPEHGWERALWTLLEELRHSQTTLTIE